MQYFTKQLWSGAQCSDDADNPGNWEAAFKEYQGQLEKLRSRFAPHVFDFFAHADIHDGELIKLNVIDGSRPAPLGKPSRRWTNQKNHPVRVDLTILDAHDKLVWELSYSSLRRVLVDFPSDEPLFYSDGDGFNDIGYQELTDCENGFYRHEILFSTGANLLFEFRNVEVKNYARDRKDL